MFTAVRGSCPGLPGAANRVLGADAEVYANESVQPSAMFFNHVTIRIVEDIADR